MQDGLVGTARRDPGQAGQAAGAAPDAGLDGDAAVPDSPAVVAETGVGDRAGDVAGDGVPPPRRAVPQGADRPGRVGKVVSTADHRPIRPGPVGRGRALGAGGAGHAVRSARGGGDRAVAVRALNRGAAVLRRDVAGAVVLAESPSGWPSWLQVPSFLERLGSAGESFLRPRRSPSGRFCRSRLRPATRTRSGRGTEPPPSADRAGTDEFGGGRRPAVVPPRGGIWSAAASRHRPSLRPRVSSGSEATGLFVATVASCLRLPPLRTQQVQRRHRPRFRAAPVPAGAGRVAHGRAATGVDQRRLGI